MVGVEPPLWFLWAISAGAVALTGLWLRSKQKKDARKRQLKQWIARALAERDGKIHKCLDLSVEENDLTRSLTAAEIRSQVVSGKLDPTEHIVRLAKRCRIFGRNESGSNAVTEELYNEAYQTALKLKSKGSVRDAGVLYGVPISVKDCIALKGCYSTGGLACRLRQRDDHDSLIVQVLKSAGAIPLCRGNVPQIMMLPESCNRIWGKSRNPWDLTRTPGGSSGGDGALVAMGCVPLAICSDVAGSIRIPAAFCGVVGFKPTSTRLSSKGNMKPRKDDKNGTSVAIPVTVGPVARTVEDCALFMKAACVPELFDGDLNVPRVPFDDKAYQSSTRLKIGYFATDGWFEPCAAAKRALQETIDTLTEAGHECVPFDPPTDGWFSYGLLVKINGAEGNFRNFTEALEGEDIIPEYNTLVHASNLPNWLRWIVLKFIDKRRGHLLDSTRSGGISVWDLWQRTAEIVEMRSIWSDAVQAAGIDAVLHPALPLPALPHGISGKLTSAFSYMFLANMLMWPAGTVPVTLVRPDEQRYDFETLPPNQRDFMASLAEKVMEKSAGLPMSVSVMTTAFQDEKCLRVMKEVERAVGFSAVPTEHEKHRLATSHLPK